MTMFLMMVAYIIGIIMGLYIKNIASIFLFLIGIILFKIMIYLFVKYSSKSKKINSFLSFKKFILILMVFLFSFTYIKFKENSFKEIPNEVEVQAIVVSNPKEKEYKNDYKIKVAKINNNDEYKNVYLLLSVKNKNIKIEYGDRIFFRGEYEEPAEESNYGGFNYKEYLKIDNISGLVTTSDINKIEKQKYNKILIHINNISTKITQNANKILKKNEASILTSILIGNKDNLSDDVQQSFRDSNLSHMLAVSGAHTTYIILGLTTILNKFKLHKKLSKILTIIFLLFFIVLTGSTSSVTRACIMAIYIIIGTLIYRKVNVIASISISLLIILVINPYRILDIGLQLSYGGTIGIILFNKVLSKKINKIINVVKNKYVCKIKIPRIIKKALNLVKEMFIVSLSANIVIFPIIAFHYNTLSLTFFISNILAGPLLGIIIILGFLIIFVSFISVKLAGIISFVIYIPLKLLIVVANFSSNLPFSKIYVPTPDILIILIYYTILILFSIKQLRNLRDFLY